MEKELEKDWIYVGKSKRFKGATHQELRGRRWVTIKTLEDYLGKLYNEDKVKSSRTDNE